ncbi:MAG: GNAT family N-acetyltransferase [Anaerolineae bacterium]|nr:GNAT family N-acetyltransferase [Anaerolineae bacterium]MCO5192181.1 GNAT family N-acetyltransferase [Anaerolineae bacterium]
MADIIVGDLKPGEEALWDSYVRRKTDAGFMQLAGWKQVLDKTYGHETRYLVAREGDLICGILPLFVLNSRLFGTSVTSPPGAICADDERSGQALLEAAIALTDELDADGLSLTASTHVWDGDLVTVQRHCTQRLALPDDDAILWKSISRHKRKNVNRSQREGVSVVTGGAEYIDFFYNVFATSVHLLGTPVFTKELVENIFAEFPDQTRILVAMAENNRPIGALLLFLLENNILAQWAASYRDDRDLRPNDALYWAMLEWGCQNGIHCVDMGRSQWHSGNYKFKALWGAETQPLYYQHYLRRGTSIPDLDLKMERVPFYRLARWGWQHMPLSLSLKLGPYLRKNLYPL